MRNEPVKVNFVLTEGIWVPCLQAQKDIDPILNQCENEKVQGRNSIVFLHILLFRIVVKIW